MTPLLALADHRFVSVKRLRHNPRVEIAPCGRFGAVADGVQPLRGVAEVRESPADLLRGRAVHIAAA
ncbi:MAG: hypothetical protein ABWY29_01500 [Blastococcus sp.]